jgi:hypothetical protein
VSRTVPGTANIGAQWRRDKALNGKWEKVNGVEQGAVFLFPIPYSLFPISYFLDVNPRVSAFICGGD